MRAYRFWSKKDLEELEKFCRRGKYNSILDAAKKFRQVHPGRSVNAIRMQIREHPEWLEHFEGEENIKSSAISPEQEQMFKGTPEEWQAKAHRLLEILKMGSSTVAAISEDPLINIPKELVWPLIDVLRGQGYEVVEEKRRVTLVRSWKEVERTLPPLTKSRHIEVLFTEGPCFGLKTQQGDLLATCLAIGEERQVFFNVMLGNLVAGYPPKTKRDDYFLTSVDEQAEYVVSHFPRASFNTFLLNGPRELSFRKRGERIESLICTEREDIRYLGDKKRIIPIGKDDAKVAIVSTEGQAYTKSYPLQGIAESFQEAYTYVFEHSDPFRALIVGGGNSGVLIPRAFPPHPERYNDFDKVMIPTLHRNVPSQTVTRRRGGSPTLGCLVLGAKFGEDGSFTGFTYAFYDLTAYFKDDDYLEDVNDIAGLSPEARGILAKLRKGPARPGELSRAIGRAIRTSQNKKGGSPSVEEALEDLREHGYQIEFNNVRKAWELKGRQLKSEFTPIDLKRLFSKTSRFLLTSDWHIGHEGERPDLIAKVYELAKERGVEAIVHSGNLFEGVGSYRGHHRDLRSHNLDEQRDRLLDMLPKSSIPLVVIASPVWEHDRSAYALVGHDVVKTFTKMANSAGHPVLYLGGPHGNFSFKDVKYDVFHPRGGIPYGKTYRLQNIIEVLVQHMLSLSNGERATFVGHLHIAAFMLYKGIAGFHVPTLKDAPEDEYIRALGKVAQLGVWIVEFSFDNLNNLTKVEFEYIPFEPLRERFREVDLDGFVKQWASRAKKSKK